MKKIQKILLTLAIVGGISGGMLMWYGVTHSSPLFGVGLMLCVIAWFVIGARVMVGLALDLENFNKKED